MDSKYVAALEHGEETQRGLAADLGVLGLLERARLRIGDVDRSLERLHP